MYCPKCGKNNIDRAVYCAKCGVKLEDALGSIHHSAKAERPKKAGKKPGKESAKAPSDEKKTGAGKRSDELKKLKLRMIVMLLFGILLLFCVAAIAISISDGCTGGGTSASAYGAVTPKPTVEPVPYDQIKPTPKPTPVPTVEPVPYDQIKPTPKPTPEPSETPAPSASSPALSTEWQEDCIPIDALCDYMLSGKAESIRLALPPEFLQYKIASYGMAGALLGGDDKVLEYAAKLIITGINMKYGSISSIDYELISRRALSTFELAGLCSQLPNYGMTTMPAEARCLVVDISFSASKGEFTERLEPRILLIDGAWYIDPEDIDF